MRRPPVGSRPRRSRPGNLRREFDDMRRVCAHSTGAEHARCTQLLQNIGSIAESGAFDAALERRAGHLVNPAPRVFHPRGLSVAHFANRKPVGKGDLGKGLVRRLAEGFDRHKHRSVFRLVNSL